MSRASAWAAFVLLVLVAAASPAAAHAGDDRGPSNHRVAISDDRLPPGVTARLLQAETVLELAWSGDGELVVLGYDREPYLRFDADGVAQNRRSPAAYLNASYDGEAVPPTADPRAEPEWEQVADGPVHRWHDHRFHAPTSPPPGEADRQVVAEWAIPVVIDDEERSLTGVIEWVPPPPAWPWWVAAGALAVLVVAAGLRLGLPVLLVALLVAVAADAIRVIGIVTEVGGGWSTVVDVAAVGAVGWALAVAAAVLGARGRREDALVAGAIAGAIVAVTGGLLELGDLPTSQLASALPDAVARASVAAALGVGLGAAVVGGLSLIRPQTR